MTEFPSRLLFLVTAPASEPITLAEAKLFLRVDGSEEDSLITDLIVAARESAENYLRKSLITQSWKVAFNDGVSESVPLPLGPVQSISTVKTYTKDDIETVVSTSNYHLNAAKNLLIFDNKPSAHRIEINYTAGYGNADDVPQSIRQGILQHIQALYHHREAGGTISSDVRVLYDSFKEIKI